MVYCFDDCEYSYEVIINNNNRNNDGDDDDEFGKARGAFKNSVRICAHELASP